MVLGSAEIMTLLSGTRKAKAILGIRKRNDCRRRNYHPVDFCTTEDEHARL